MLLSSSILALSFWETIRGYSRKTQPHKVQSVIFASAWCLAVFNASILPKCIFSVAEIELYNPISVTSSALLIVLAMQTLMFFQAKEQNSKNKKQGNEIALTTILDALSENISHNNEYVDPDLLAGMAKLINEQKLYLQTNLKIVDFAQALQVPEYKNKPSNSLSLQSRQL